MSMDGERAPRRRGSSDARSRGLAPEAHPPPAEKTPTYSASSGVHDTLGRPLHDLRISVTDRCNFRCTYCMPKEVFGRDHPFLERRELLSFEEIARLARIFVGQGVEKIRLTGGEPTLRNQLPKLIEMLARTGGLYDLTMTTNGSRLAQMARSLKDAALTPIPVSLDSLDDAVFRAMNDVDFPVSVVRKTASSSESRL